MIAIGSPSIAESELSTMTTEPKYAVRVNDLQSPAEAEKVTKIICNGKMVQFFFSNYFALTGLGIFTLIYSGDHWNFKIQVNIQNMKQTRDFFKNPWRLRRTLLVPSVLRVGSYRT